MITEDLRALLNTQQAFADKYVTQKHLSKIDNIILSDLPDEDSLSIYKKFCGQNVVFNRNNNELLILLKNFAKEKLADKNYSSALLIYRLLIIKATSDADIFYDISQIMNNLNQYDSAIEFIKLYEETETNLPLKLLTLANFFNLQLKDYKNAIKYYERYLKIDETKAAVYTILASLYAKEYGDLSLKDQIYYFEKAYHLRPHDRLILHGLAFCYEKTGQKATAQKYYKELLNNNPSENDYFNYGGFLINCGNFEEGHKYFAHRFNIDDINLKYPLPDADEKKWDLKTDITDKTLLIHYEQGFGDTFMYCRFVPDMKKFAKNIIFVVQDEVYELIKASKIINAGIKIVSDKSDLSKLKYDYHMALLDTPYVLKTNPANLPYPEGYLSVSDKMIKDYAKKHLKTGKNLKIGIAYHGNKNANYHGRDIDFSLFKVLFNIKGADFYSFSTEKENDERIICLNETFDNFTQTACALKNMDMVITTDNVILNLSGALGVKTIGLFNKYTNYRWFKTTGDNVGWYNSVKPMQTEDESCWTEVFEQLYTIVSDAARLN